MIDKYLIIFYLDLKIQYYRENIILKLSKLVYINKILKKFHLNKANIR